MSTYLLYKELQQSLQDNDEPVMSDCLQPHNPIGDLRLESTWSDVTWKEITNQLWRLYRKTPEELAVGDVLHVLTTPSFSRLRSIAVEMASKEDGLTFDVKYENGINTADIVAGNKATATYATTNTYTVGAGDTANFGALADNTKVVTVVEAGNDDPLYLTSGKYGSISLTILSVPAVWTNSAKIRIRENHDNYAVAVNCGCSV